MASTGAVALRPLGAWRAHLLVAPSAHRRRLPRDVVDAVFGACLAAGSWWAVAAGAGEPFSVRLPAWISWLVTLIAMGGTIGLIVVSVLVCVLGRRWALIAQMAVAAGVVAAGCVGIAHWLDAGSQVAPPLIAATFATAVLVVRTLAVPLRKWWWIAADAGAVAQVMYASLVPAGTLGAAGLGLMAGALAGIVFGSPDGMPTTADVERCLAELGVHATGVTLGDRAPTWGAVRFTGHGDQGRMLDIDVYGRDAPEGQFLSRLWRFLWIRRSTFSLRLRRLGHIEHTAALMLWARSAGVEAPSLVAAGRAGPADEALLVTSRPAGRPLGSLTPGEVAEEDLEAMWRSVQSLAGAGIALRGVRPDTIAVGPGHRVAFLEFAHGEAMASEEACLLDEAALLIATTQAAGAERAVKVAAKVVGTERVVRLLPLIQPRALPAGPERRAPHLKRQLAELRQIASDQLGTEPVEPVPLARFQLSKIIMLSATFLGIWLLVEQFVGLGGIWDVLVGASLAWMLATLAVTQATLFSEALSMTGATQLDLPLGPLVMLRSGLDFTGLIGGTAANTATVVRFYQRHGQAPSVALSSGVIYGVGGFIVQVALTLTTLIVAGDQLHLEAAGPAGSSAEILQLILYAIVIVGLAAGIASLVPKLRRAAVSRLQPQFAAAWNNLRAIASSPGKLVRLFGGATLTQLLMAAGLGCALRSVGASASLAGLIIVCTFTAVLGGMVPIPGGMGVMEASYIAGLTLLGVNQDLAIAATFIYRLATTYLPPIWGWGALVWLRRHEAL